MPTPKLLDKSESSQLDRYELIGEIASGGMATVFLARLAGVGGFQRFFAIKRLHPHLSNETEFVQMFLDEARLAASIHHPHVVPILEVGTSSAGYYVVMEYVEGDTMAGLMAREASRGKKLPAPVALRIALDTLSGLHAAHDLRDEDNNPVNLVHRDVSPQNILVGVDGSARITDFGVAKASSRLTSTREGTLKGKLAYMPPEQAKAGTIDQRTDIFALGVVLWEALAGRRLFKGETELETLNRLLFEPIPTVRTYEPLIPEVVEQVVMRALDRDPNQRFSSSAEFADALERACQQSGFRVATVRETATCVQQIIGNEIQQQRAAVRAWLAAEPSQQGVDPESLAALRSSRPPSTRRTTPLPVPPSSHEVPALPASTQASDASSIGALLGEPSSARSQSTTGGAMALPEAPPSSTALESLVPPPPSRRLLLVPFAAFALLGLGFFGWTRLNEAPSVASPSMTASAPAATTALTTTAPLAATAPTPSATTSAAPPATASATASALPIDALPPERPAPTALQRPIGKKNDPREERKDPPPATATATAAPTSAPTPTAKPDEGYTNPYR
jgi:serine/threonine-protein kinase